MKILVVSDSHGNFNVLHAIYKKENPDYMIFCGDGTNDIRDLSYAYKELKYKMVRGNCDFNDYNVNINEEISFGNYNFLITHGHYYDVKSSLIDILKEGKRLKKNVVIFGHTHRKYYKEIDEINLFNPGSVNNGNYGIIDIKEENIIFELKFIEI